MKEWEKEFAKWEKEVNEQIDGIPPMIHQAPQNDRVLFIVSQREPPHPGGK